MSRTPQAIAREYRELLAWVRQQPESEQWRYGAALKRLQAEYTVECEYRQAGGR